MDVVILGFVTSFFTVLLATPSLIKVAKMKHLVDEPGEARKLHNKSVPTIGGIIIFAAVVFAYALWIPADDRNNPHYIEDFVLIQDVFTQFKYVIACLIILFFVGVKDDIIGTAPVKKLLAHIIVGFVLVMMADIKITGLQGLFGVERIPEWAVVLLSVFVYIVIVNAFNLIDGVDGLAAGIGLVSCMSFGIWFFLADNIPVSLLAFTLGGALLGFLIFNFNPAKIFMGDSGSLTIGAIISVLAINMIEHEPVLMPGILENVSRPVMAMAIVVYPLIDTLRIFIYRALKGQSPFSADKNHIHHKLLKIGAGHKGAVIVLYLGSIATVCSVIVFTWMGFSDTVVLVLVFCFAIGLAQLPYFFKNKTKIGNADEAPQNAEENDAEAELA